MDKSKVERMGASRWEKAWKKYETARDKYELFPCEYGHISCSPVEGGFCMNELENVLFADSPEHWD